MRVLRISHSSVVGEWRRRERAIRSHGVDVRLLTARRWDEGGQRVSLDPAPGEHVQGVRTVGTHPNLFVYDPVALWRALGEGWDVVDVHEEPYSLATAEVLALLALRRARRTPVVLYSAQNIAKRFPPPFGWLERRALRRAAAVAVCNAEAGRIVRARGLTGPARLIGLGVDLGRFAPAPTDGLAPDPAGEGVDVLRVGYVGRLAAHKGVDVLLEAAARDPRLHVRVAGGGPDAAALRTRAEQPDLAGRVQLLGPLDQEALTAFYRELDVLAVPSVPTAGWREQFCRVAVEAMASGCVVVASDTGALPDVVGDAGVLVPPRDVAALGAALGALHGDPARRDELRARGLARARAFSWERIGEQYVELYREVAAGHASASAPPASAPSPARTSPQVSVPVPDVVVVAYGAPDLLARCLERLGPTLPVVVVDNSSDPDVREVVDRAGADYVDPGRNLGFARAVNLAVARRDRTDTDVLLLNPDAAIDAAGIRELQHALHAEPDVAAVAPAQRDDTGTDAQVMWPFPSPRGAWLQAVGLARLHRGAPFAIGSVLLLRGAALTDVGALDEDFFLYSEETDWQYRAHHAGWRAEAVPAVVATHVGGGTSTDPLRRETHFHASQERYLRKHFGAHGWTAARTAVVLGGVARGVVLPGARGREARRRVRLYVRGPLRAEATLPEPRDRPVRPDATEPRDLTDGTADA
ncbi:glycosyltransferase [Cellulomonas sp. P22]|uniref:glycosyltransferase n=1 Tax=Cellulomonas sp. P22 TaxID=3373189 RepID=UPI0037B30458